MDFNEIIQNLNFSSVAWQIITPLIFSVSDIITGYIQAIINKNVESSVMRTGLLRKCLLIVVLILSEVIQFAFNLPYISSIISIYIVIMELMSIIENLTKAGLDFGKLADILKIKGSDNNE